MYSLIYTFNRVPHIPCSFTSLPDMYLYCTSCLPCSLLSLSPVSHSFVALYSLIPCLLLFCCFRSLQLPHTDDLPPHLPQLLKHITAWNGAKASSSLQCECVQECAEASVCVCVCQERQFCVSGSPYCRIQRTATLPVYVPTITNTHI